MPLAGKLSPAQHPHQAFCDFTSCLKNLSLCALCCRNFLYRSWVFCSGDFIVFNNSVWQRQRIQCSLHLQYHDWGETLEQGTKSPTALRAPQDWLPTAPCGVCVCVCGVLCVCVVCVLCVVCVYGHCCVCALDGLNAEHICRVLHFSLIFVCAMSDMIVMYMVSYEPTFTM